MLKPADLNVESLGPCRQESPLQFDSPNHDRSLHFVSDATRIRLNIKIGPEHDPTDEQSFEEAGPREELFFNPTETVAAIVTCGGLSPGLNNVIRSAYYELSENYKVSQVLGIRNGYLGLNPESELTPITLSCDFVESIDKLGGTALGSSRGAQDPAIIVEFLRARGIDILLCVGGDGTQRGAQALHAEIRRRQLPISIVGIPKTIDNDIPFVSRSFGYITALEKAAQVVRGAHVEARGAPNGIGLVKLMGRHAGFIAAGAAVVSQEVNFCLVPEIAFPLTGENGFLPTLEKRIIDRKHAVIVVAEGAGQHLLKARTAAHDTPCHRQETDIGIFLKEEINDYFGGKGIPVAIKYLDPSYFIRSVPADVYDRYLCDQLARHAVHAAMAGKTGITIGFEHEQFIHVPIPAVIATQKLLDLTGDLWRAVLQVTNQPRW